MVLGFLNYNCFFIFTKKRHIALSEAHITNSKLQYFSLIYLWHHNLGKKFRALTPFALFKNGLIPYLNKTNLTHKEEQFPTGKAVGGTFREQLFNKNFFNAEIKQSSLKFLDTLSK